MKEGLMSHISFRNITAGRMLISHFQSEEQAEE